MKPTLSKIPVVVGLTLLCAAATTQAASPSQARTPFKATIPKTSDDAVMADLELPLIEAGYSPKHVSADYYYRIAVRPIYKSYPVYHPSREPHGYLERLRRDVPVVLWDDQDKHPKLKREADWIKAGELVFDAPIVIGSGRISRFRFRISSASNNGAIWIAADCSVIAGLRT